MAMSSQSVDIVDRAVGMAIGTAVGDALGIPFENLTRKEIKDIQMSLSREESLFVNVAGRNPYIPKEWATGRWGDATQLSLAVMRAIVKHLDDDAGNLPLLNCIVDEHVREWRLCTDGWGNGTKSAIERIAQGSHSCENSGGPSTGNGVIMKLTPIAFFFHICQLSVDEELVEGVCRMTHDSPVTLATALIYISLCLFIFEHGLPSSDGERKAFLQDVFDVALKYEAKYNLAIEKDLLSVRVHRYMTTFDQMNTELLLDVSDGGTYFCVETLSMVVGFVAVQRLTFQTLLKAIEMGGDTNIVAAMLGALLGATEGRQSIDPARGEHVFRADFVRQVGEEFGQTLVYQQNRLPTH